MTKNIKKMYNPYEYNYKESFLRAKKFSHALLYIADRVEEKGYFIKSIWQNRSKGLDCSARVVPTGYIFIKAEINHRIDKILETASPYLEEVIITTGYNEKGEKFNQGFPWKSWKNTDSFLEDFQKDKKCKPNEIIIRGYEKHIDTNIYFDIYENSKHKKASSKKSFWEFLKPCYKRKLFLK